MTRTPVRVLLVEDDEEDWLLTRGRLLTGDGAFDLVWAPSLADARGLLASSSFHVILTDLNLPDSRGWDTVEQLRRLASDTALVVLTEVADDELGLRAVVGGAQDYLVKGEADERALTRAIRYALERKASERALHRYRDRLEELVRTRTDRIRRANAQLSLEVAERRKAEEHLRKAMAQLEEHNLARSRFVTNVSHDLRTPLSSMLCALENLQGGVVGPIDTRAQSYLTMLREDCNRLLSTVNDILDLSRIEARTLVLHRVRVSFRRLVHQAGNSLRMLALEKNINFTVNADTAYGFVDCDPDKMGRVLVNVIQNAIKFTPSGGFIEVTLRRDKTDAKRFVLDVLDTGVGIPEEHLGRVTDRYFRVNEDVPGSGLGLAISREFLALHGGDIELTSPVPGQSGGTQVSILLPAAPPPSVLLTTGDSDVQSRAQGELEQEGYEVFLCADTEAAMRQLLTRKPDAVVLGLTGQAADGFEVIAHLNSSDAWRSVPAIAVLDGEMDTVRRELLDGCRIPSLRKRWHPPQLLGMVEGAMVARAVGRR